MSNHKIEDSVGLDGIIAAAEACKGAPNTIQPGVVVAMAEALEACLDSLGDEMALPYEVIQEARDALAMYYGENQ